MTVDTRAAGVLALEGVFEENSAEFQGQPYRTADILSTAESFKELLLPESILEGLAAAGFHKPSPVQQAAIPLARAGSDLLVQAKSGTGKTAVFGVACIEQIESGNSFPQALVLAPTREIALQSADVIRALASCIQDPGIGIAAFIGGLPIEEDQKALRRVCQIVVGTPGRICALLEKGDLVTRKLQLLVLDEADSLMSDTFRDDVFWIHSVLPKQKQVLAFSATYTPALQQQVESLMRQPKRILLASETVSLLGVRQFYKVLPEAEISMHGKLGAKVKALLHFLGSVIFHQVVVFCNVKTDAEQLAEQLNASSFPAAFISGNMSQVKRMDVISAVRSFAVRVIISTDLVARGIDLERVNVVANLDLPPNAATYMHRVGRTGRFGTHGLAVTFATERELIQLKRYVQDISGGKVEPLPSIIPEEDYAYLPAEGQQSSPKPQPGINTPETILIHEPAANELCKDAAELATTQLVTEPEVAIEEADTKAVDIKPGHTAALILNKDGEKEGSKVSDINAMEPPPPPPPPPPLPGSPSNVTIGTHGNNKHAAGVLTFIADAGDEMEQQSPAGVQSQNALPSRDEFKSGTGREAQQQPVSGTDTLGTKQLDSALTAPSPMLSGDLPGQSQTKSGEAAATLSQPSQRQATAVDDCTPNTSAGEAAFAESLAAQYPVVEPGKWWVGESPYGSGKLGNPGPEWHTKIQQQCKAALQPQTEDALEELYAMMQQLSGTSVAVRCKAPPESLFEPLEAHSSQWEMNDSEIEAAILAKHANRIEDEFGAALGEDAQIDTQPGADDLEAEMTDAGCTPSEQEIQVGEEDSPEEEHGAKEGAAGQAAYDSLSTAEQQALWDAYYYQKRPSPESKTCGTAADQDDALADWEAWYRQYRDNFQGSAAAEAALHVSEHKQGEEGGSQAKTNQKQASPSVPKQTSHGTTNQSRPGISKGPSAAAASRPASAQYRVSFPTSTEQSPDRSLGLEVAQPERVQASTANAAQQMAEPGRGLAAQGQHAFWDPGSAQVDPDGFVRVPAALLARYHQLEWQYWSRAGRGA